MLAPLRIEQLALGGPAGTSTLRTGMGPDRARIAAARALAHSAPALVVAGVCAGIDPALRAGDVVCATELVGEDGERVAVPGSSLLVAALRRRGLRVHVGPIASAGRILSPAERRLLPGRSPRGRHGVGLARGRSRRAAARGRSGRRGRGRAEARRPSDRGRGLEGASQPAPARRSARRVGRCRRAQRRSCSPARARSAPASNGRSTSSSSRSSSAARRCTCASRSSTTSTSSPTSSARGAIFVEELDEVPDGATLVFSAHGVSPAVRQDAGTRTST